jgi:hypothetical protein
MIESILIIALSLALFVYWFRYTVLLLLSQENSEQQSQVLGQLCLLETREALGKADSELALDRLNRALEKDYRMLRYLLDHAAGLGLRPVEHFLLMLDYRMMRIWYRLTRNSSTTRARRALDEMAGILSYIAYRMGEQAGKPSRA